MKMLGCCQIVEVQILYPHLKHRARISEDAASGCEWKDQGDPRVAAGSGANHAANLHARLPKPLAAHLSPHTATDSRAKGSFATKKRQIVRKNGGGTAKSESKATREDFAFFRQFTRQSIDNQIRIELSHNSDVWLPQSAFARVDIHHFGCVHPLHPLG